RFQFVDIRYSQAGTEACWRLHIQYIKMIVWATQLSLYCFRVRPANTRCQPAICSAITVLNGSRQKRSNRVGTGIIAFLAVGLPISEFNTRFVSDTLKGNQSANTGHLAFSYAQIQPLNVAIEP